jgi:glycogen debranching enzyme
MDADLSGNGLSIVTPRNGKAVEINALWYSNLRFVSSLLSSVQDFSKAKEYNQIADRVRISFNSKFWNSSEEALFDVIEGDNHGGAIRPNMLFAISIGGDLVSPIKQAAIFRSAKKDLLTPGGLRTLSPRDSYYQGTYDTNLPMDQKDRAYHQGTAWPWLMGAYCDSLAIVRRHQGKSEGAIRLEIIQALYLLVRFCLESPYKSLPEVFSGDAPYEPGGTTSQAWSVAEVLRILDQYNLVSRKPFEKKWDFI